MSMNFITGYLCKHVFNGNAHHVIVVDQLTKYLIDFTLTEIK